MSDLFAAIHPPYGSLSPSEEFSLHNSDYAAWLRYVAPASAKKLMAGGAESIAMAWPLMTEDYKRAVWALFDEPTRELVRLVRASQRMVAELEAAA